MTTRIESGARPPAVRTAGPPRVRSGRTRRLRTRALVVGGGSALIALAFLSLSLGAGEPFTPRSVVTALMGHADASTQTLVVGMRLPRTLVALCVGASLGVAGAVMQAFTRNPLADPGLLGVNAGAALGVVISVFVFGAAGTGHFVLAALIGAFITTILVLLVGSMGRGPATPLKLTLSGVAIAAVLGGITTAIRLSDPITFNRILAWASGSVAGRSLDHLAHLAILMVAGVSLAFLIAKPLNAIALGEDLANSLGAHVARTRVFAIIVVSLLAGGATAIAGPIAFVGLMIPHVCRWAVGPDQPRILATTLLLAPALLLSADVVSRIILPLREVPVGLVTAFIGAPVLIWLVRRGKASAL